MIQIATALAVIVAWLFVAAVIDRPLSVPVARAASGTFDNTMSISIPAFGSATPYPSEISVSGLSGTITKVTVTITRYSHQFPSEVDILLVGPTGAKVLLMSDTGFDGGADIVTLTFDDAAASFLPLVGNMVTGTFKPTNVDNVPPGDPDIFLAPAPSGPYGSALSAFNGTDPNGTWQLFVVDDTVFTGGSIALGWSLTIETPDPTPTMTLTSTATVTSTPTATATGTLIPTATPTGIVTATVTASPTATLTPTVTGTLLATATGTTTATATGTVTASGAPAPPENKGDSGKPKTEEQRQQEQRTNRSNRSDYVTEGNVLEVGTTSEGLAIVISNVDGRVMVLLRCGLSCPTIRVGDYIEVDGEKVHEQLYEAESVTVVH